MNAPLLRCTPESVGIPAAAIQAFVDAVEARVGGLHSLMLLRHGQVAAEAWWAPYAPERPHMLYSLSKSFTSTAVGLAVAEGLLSVDDPVLSFFQAETPHNVSRNLAAMRVHHLLSMNTGHDVDTTEAMIAQRGGDWARAFLSLPVNRRPGSHFLYNTGATYMLSAIVQRLTKQTVLDYITPRLFEPLGITGATWETCPKGVNTGGFGLSVRTEDIARFGQLYLQQGVWQGQRLLPAAWVEQATSAQSDNSSQPNPDWQQGYGYQFWRCRHGAYRGDGAFGQYCLVMPTQDAVLAITSGVNDMQAVLDLVWQHLLPAMGATPLPDDARAQAALARTLASRQVPPVQGAAQPPIEAGGRYELEANPLGLKSLTMRATSAGMALRLQGAQGSTELLCAPGVWQAGKVVERPSAARSPRRAGLPQPPVLASGAWVDERVYLARLCYAETPFVIELRCELSDAESTENKLTLQVSVNVSFGAREWPVIWGHRKA